MSPTISEAYRELPLPPHHIVPIDFGSLKSVPFSHQWFASDTQVGKLSTPSLKPRLDSHAIPVVDLASPDVLERLGRACEEWGVFQVVGHGISSEELEEVESQAERFFALPPEVKARVLRSPDGGAGYGIARISSFFSKFMWHEGFTIMGSSLDYAKQIWPHDYQHFSDVMDEYQKKVKNLSQRLMLQILSSLKVSDLPETSSICPNPATASTALQLNHYPSCPDPDLALGLAPHTDSFLITVLHQARRAHGLQVFNDRAGGWVPVSPLQNALVVNVGDLLHVLSNGRYVSALHRVAVSERSRERVSVAYFYGPAADAEVAPLGAAAPVYRRFKVVDYVKLKARELDKAMSLMRI
uniref:Fe2OG dioxygenase domain-containing protein n=1 Tax=Kalanchoe fedtschenkoi TaxID=63787 RepID=A0A7N1A0J7_KALFE